MKVTILVCYHKISPIIANEVLQPILVGAEYASVDVKNALESACKRANTSLYYDNSGEHISGLNPYFCELTAMYWAWKNLDCDYYGFFHYRRVLDFSDGVRFDMPRKEKVRYSSLCGIMDNAFYESYALLAQNIEQVCHGYDIILPTKVIDHDQKERAQHLSLYGLYEKVHYAKDMDMALAYISSKYPHMHQSALQTLHKKPMLWYIANMFVMKRELYFAYCEWVFDILFALQERIPYKSYDVYQARVFGFLAERLFNIWLEYQKQTNPKLRIKELPLVLLNPKAHKRWLGWVQEGNVRRFYVAKLRVLKQYL
ncbi:DUF4422 domain-containing protein [Helicobacter marmotae]|uniref:DUF4422 domain-containing protein n=1 Tax=Helicobacter marmotae TaxID=152490 RepID=A0A3D8I5N3_9HELI|nr:DUF4422 domain-containing protein [Helicobacter marmotae]RDU60453.1 DUF4422 domain-containing protein [Helicobacter marmotae]